MKAYDFEYDGANLSNIGFTICEFGTDGLQTVTNGSQITFNTVSTFNGAKYELLSSTYDSCLETTFQICKTPCSFENLEITPNDLRYIMSWLNRRTYHKFKLLEPGYYDFYFEASFNVSQIKLGGKICGLELNLKTNSPFALHEPRTITIDNTEANGTHSITDESDEEGFIYPKMEIGVKEDGNLSIYNALEDKIMLINNCKSGEIITLDYPVIETSMPSHKIQNDFNWSFFRIANTFKTKKNDITISIPCTITITYSPVVKLGF